MRRATAACTRSGSRPSMMRAIAASAPSTSPFRTTTAAVSRRRRRRRRKHGAAPYGKRLALVACVTKRMQAILLDIDGTLVDSNDQHAHCWVEAFAHFDKQV